MYDVNLQYPAVSHTTRDRLANAELPINRCKNWKKHTKDDDPMRGRWAGEEKCDDHAVAKIPLQMGVQ